MTTLQHLEIVLQNEELDIIDLQMMAEIMESCDNDLLMKYKNLVTRHRNLLNMVSGLVSEVSSRSNEMLTNKAIMEQNYFDLRRRNFELFHMAAYDDLTQIYSRKFILEALAKELIKCRRDEGTFIVAMVDLDNFKEVNDTYGHPVGDRVLKAMAKVIENSLRPEDLVGRYGGDEFVVILPDTLMVNGIQVLERLCSKVADEVVTAAGDDIQITASFGCHIFDHQSSLDHEELIYYADRALLDAKKRGKNRVTTFELSPLKVNGM